MPKPLYEPDPDQQPIPPEMPITPEAPDIPVAPIPEPPLEASMFRALQVEEVALQDLQQKQSLDVYPTS
jgi:hypothetical protein